MNFHPEIAVITPNILMGLGLKSILEKIIPMATVEVFTSFEDLTDADPARFSHYFTAHTLFVAQPAFFADCPQKTILMTDAQQPSTGSSLPTLHVDQSEEALVHDILKLHENVHRHGHPVGEGTPHPTKPLSTLTTRETEVLRLLAEGCINKEIASRLHISTTTVISHRKNIIEKLGIRSVAGLTIYAMKNGYLQLISDTHPHK
ncbi:MAG: LuxR C-terminal-related transcriptional regulator [Alistipes sp.]